MLKCLLISKHYLDIIGRLETCLYIFGFMRPTEMIFFNFCALRLHMVTWNVATADPPDDLSSLLHLNSTKSPDLYVIG